MWRENLFLDAFDVLDSLREHLEGDAADNESGLSPHLEPTQVQVLSKFAAELSKLYECCKDNEFAEDRSLSNHSSIESLIAPVAPTPSEDDAMVSRFVRIVTTVAQGSSSGPGSRFLSQAQRSCMDLLKAMATSGSPEALLNLTIMAGTSFFAERDPSGKALKGVDILCHEASNVVLDAFSSNQLTDECKVVVLARLLSLFPEGENAVNKTKDVPAVGIAISTLTPVMRQGLESAKRLDNGPQETSRDMFGVLDILWKKVFGTLSRMLSLAPNGSKRIDISHAADLVELVTAAATNCPSRHSPDLFSVLSSGASRCMDVAKLTEESGGDIKDILNLFAACFVGSCRKDKAMQGIAKNVLNAAADSLTLVPPKTDFKVKASLKVFQVVQEIGDIEGIVIAIFPELSRLVCLDDASLRRAAGALLVRANISTILDNSQTRWETAEERARTAEERVLELEEEVEVLHRQKEALERQLGLL